MGHVKAVETYLRNFEAEKARDQEILDITLCYGIQCLARTFSLQGLTCNDLSTLTGYDTIKSRDFYVRKNASHSLPTTGNMSPQRRPTQVRLKPSHSWRDGEVERPEPLATVKADSASTSDGKNGALDSLPPAFDEMDYLTKLVGKAFMELAWKTFAGKELSQFTTKQEFDAHFVGLEQRKAPTMLYPAVKLPVASFPDFVRAYLMECVRQSRWTSAFEEVQSDSGGDSSSNNKDTKGWARRNAIPSPRKKEPRQRSSEATGNTKSSKVAQVGVRRKETPPVRHVPPSLRSVPSKIQPELHTRRQKLLRVKKTQTQRRAEALARARLAEYDARERRLAHRRTPIRKLTTGASALEIADQFLKSPLMDKFVDLKASGDEMQAATNVAPTDPLIEELYGTKLLDSSFLRCKDKPRPRSESQLNQPRRTYNGWLGDFGPLHTKTVRPECEEAGDVMDSPVPGPKMFEWNFKHLPGRNDETVECSIACTSSDNELINRELSPRSSNDCDDALSDMLSDKLDAIFRWLKESNGD